MEECCSFTDSTIVPQPARLSPSHALIPLCALEGTRRHSDPSNPSTHCRTLLYISDLSRPRDCWNEQEMDVNSMLANGAQQGISAIDARKPPHAYPTRHAGNMPLHHGDMSPPGVSTHRPLRGNYGATAGSGHPRGSPAKKDQKHVVFQLIDPQDPRIQARLPMRVMISVHDTTESIITTVKNFYGLYEYGVSFENKGGISIIAAYENFENDMTVYVRTVPQPTVVNGDSAPILDSPKRPTLGAPFEARPSHHGSVYSPSRTAARSAGVRSMSPQSDPPQRSASAAPGAKARASKLKREDNGGLGDADGYSSDDGANASVTSSRRSKTEQVNAEISVDNIVEGGRRRHVFESSVRIHLPHTDTVAF